MLDFSHASRAFNRYVSQFETSDPKIKLKIIHTHGVVDATDYISSSLRLNNEQHELAKIIALLHDIGRFEQLRRFNSFDDRNIDHAILGVDILKQDNFLREFVSDSSYDSIIITAILNHSVYAIESGLGEEVLLQSQIIRDADKLDNYRVKEIEEFETLFDVSENELMREDVTPEIVATYKRHQLIARQDRKTHLDMWLSYMAFMFDFNFDASLEYLKKHDYVNKLFARIQPTSDEVTVIFDELRDTSNSYVHEKLTN